MIRFGWIDSSDWQAQKAASGQMAGLPVKVYKYKLLPIKGEYTLDAPLKLLDGVGPQSVIVLNKKGYFNIKDLIGATNSTGSQSESRAIQKAIEYKSEYVD